jgi:glycosyltransferase involved in cell wall biosynthesis
VDNLIKGLDVLGYPYVINKRLDACKRLWIHDDTRALKQAGSLPKDIKVLAGPNLFILPSEIPAKFNLSKMVYLQPSLWVRDLWQERGFNRCPIEIWPVGVDTDRFKPTAAQKDLVLVYFKQRLPEDLKTAENILTNKKIKYQVISYGHYKEEDYRNLLARARYVVWLGQSESQGLALLEALSSNVPLLVCDIKQSMFLQNPVSNGQEKLYNGVTSAPYFEGSCGIKISGIEGLSQAVSSMESGAGQFKPRLYVEQNLRLRQQAESFIEIYDRYFDLKPTDGYKESLLHQGGWINSSLVYRLGFFIKDAFKNLNS